MQMDLKVSVESQRRHSSLSYRSADDTEQLLRTEYSNDPRSSGASLRFSDCLEAIPLSCLSGVGRQGRRSDEEQGRLSQETSWEDQVSGDIGHPAPASMVEGTS